MLVSVQAASSTRALSSEPEPPQGGSMVWPRSNDGRASISLARLERGYHWGSFPFQRVWGDYTTGWHRADADPAVS